jgi:hypothetical protein
MTARPTSARPASALPAGALSAGALPAGALPAGALPARRPRSRAVALLVAGSLTALVACSSGPAGLGKGACPYVRPRLIRVDADRAKLPSGLADLTSVAEDFADYVRTNLPDGGRAHSDQVLVRFSAALTAYVREGAADGPALTQAEAALTGAEAGLNHECAVHGY